MKTMAAKKGFKPFYVIPKTLMMQILLQTFTKDAESTLEKFLDYKKVSKSLSKIIAHEESFQHILETMPSEFNVEIYPTLRRRITKTEEGRYRAGAALLFLKYLYSHIKPFPEDEFLLEHYDSYFSSLKYLEEAFTDSPMTMYVAGYVAFFVAKRLFVMSPLDKLLKKKAAAIYKISVNCIKKADELEHPLARLFHADMVMQLQRHNIEVEDYIKEKLPETPTITLEDILPMLVKKIPINPKNYSDEVQTLLLVTWQKLIIENYSKASEIFDYIYRNEKLLQITEYFYSCYQANHFHRHILASNPLFVQTEHVDNILYLLQSFNVDALVTLHQGFRVTHPRPDSVLLTTLLQMKINDLKDFRTAISDFLALPQKGTPGWRVAFHDAYRDAIDDGALHMVSAKQMMMTLEYLSLVEHARKIDTILDRDADILGSVFHARNDTLHDIALAIMKQLMSFNVLNPLGQLHQQELIIKLIYEDAAHLALSNIKAAHDLDRMATIILDTYAELLAPELTNQTDIKVYDYLYNNRPKLRELLHIIHTKFIESGYLKAA